MFFILFILVLIVMYVITFKENFTKEKIDKVAPILMVMVLVITVFNILCAILAK